MPVLKASSELSYYEMCGHGTGSACEGVIVSVAALPAGLRTVRTELTAVVVIIAIPTILDVPVARPATVYSKS